MFFLRHMAEDVRAVFERDPAARSTLEILLLYPGLHAIWIHRFSHRLWLWKFRFPARFLAHAARFLTGVEIHPGAVLGRRFFIDHGMGIVIGETAEVGDDVLMYQGTVLGGTSLHKGKRHPTVGNRVTIGAHASVLGPVKIEDDVLIGGGSVVITDVPRGATVVGVPGRVQKRVVEGIPILDLEHGRLRDPLADAVKMLLGIQSGLERRIEDLETQHGIRSATILRREGEGIADAGNEGEGKDV
jgi:serine O-acetyltransferase